MTQLIEKSVGCVLFLYSSVCKDFLIMSENYIFLQKTVYKMYA